MWRVCKEANRPWPKLSEDDVLDYMVMEAVAAKVAKADAEERKKQERKQWKSDVDHLKQFQ